MKYKAAAIKADSLNWWQVTNGPFADKYWKDVFKEIKVFTGMVECFLLERTEDIDVIKSTWVFKLKMFPDGLTKKFKGRFCTS